MIAVSVMFEIDPAKRDEFKAMTLRHAANTRKEPGCAGFFVFEMPGDPKRFYLHETYRDEAALEAHNKGASIAAYLEATKTMTRAAHIEKWHSVAE